MELKYNYWYFPKVIKKETCNKIISTCLKKKQVKGLVYNTIEKEGKLSLKNVKANPNIRDSKIYWISSEWIYGILNPFIHSANKQAGWNFQWDWNEPSQFTVYNKNQFYGWHCDQMAIPFGNRNSKKLNNKIRKLSLTLQLTDPSEYEGGDLQFKWFHKNTVKKEIVKIAREVGSIIVFPSSLWHQVTPITKGKRQSLVNWSIGKPFI